MKKLLLPVLFLFLSIGVAFPQSDNKIGATGDVGIGTLSPSSKLDVTTNTLGSTQTNTSGLALVNTTPATATTQQISPAIRWSAKGYAGSSQRVDFRAFVTPIPGTTTPSGYLGFGYSLNGTTYSDNQLVLASNGNVGVGTTAPTAKLELQTPNGTEQLRLSNSNGSYATFTVTNSGALNIGSPSSNPVTLENGVVVGNSAGNFFMPAFAQGSYMNNNTAYSLEGVTDIGFRIALKGWGANKLLANYSGANFLIGSQIVSTTAGSAHKVVTQQAIKPLIITGTGTVTNSASLYIEDAAAYANPTASPVANHYSLWVAKGFSRFDGKVGIGTNNIGSHELAVEGTIGARKVRVTETTPWPDYVFSPIYKLPSLSEVENFIKQHRHLPDVPSAKEVNEKGLELGDNQAILLKKIEELTLYMIDLQKQIEAQKERSRRQERIIQAQQDLLDRVEKAIKD